MKLIVGLGNPTQKYKFNRHNVGFLAIDYLVKEYNASFVKDFKGLIVLRDDNDKNSSFKWKLSVPVFKEFVFGIGGLRKVSGKFDNENKYKVFHKLLPHYPLIYISLYKVYMDN